MRVILKNNILFSCSGREVRVWSIRDKKVKYMYEFKDGNSVYDIVIGREETPLENRTISISYIEECRISNSETGTKIKTIEMGGRVTPGMGMAWKPANFCVAVNESQTLLAIGKSEKINFYETTNFTKVKEVHFQKKIISSLAFNRRNDCMLAVTSGGQVYSFKV